MSDGIPRRQFLKAAPVAGALAYAATARADTRTGEGGDAPEVDVAAWALAQRDYPIRPKLFSEVTLTDGFWKPKVDRNANVTIPFEVRKREGSTRALSGNVLEAAMLSLQTHPNAALQAQVEARVQQLKQAQPGMSNGLFEIAATYFLTTGRRDLLDNAIASAELLDANFKRNNPPFSGGERDSMNCAALYRVTQDPKHLALARHYLDIRGREDSVNRSRHNQSYKPTIEQTEAVGHAVNCVTLMVSLLDVGIYTGDKRYFNAAHRMWQDAAERKTYIIGGVGTTGNEGFGAPYSLPNISAYAETCAVLMYITLNHRLFRATGDSRYIDVLERGMYNNAIDGVSASGDHYFYVNRLASAGDGRDHRWQHASLECCPPNLVRFMAQVPGYIYAQDDDAVYVNLYVSSDATFQQRGRALTLSTRSELPWSGKSKITVAAREPVNGAIKLRIPGWARNQPLPGTLYTYAESSARASTISVNGRAVSATPDRNGYVTLARQWQDGDVIDIEFPLEARRVIADARVQDNRGRVAIERGPIVYCAEWPDCETRKALDLLLEDSARLQPRTDGSLLGGAVVIDTTARSVTNPAAPARPLMLIPYHLWANRGIGEMNVWLAREEYALGDVGPAGGFIFYINPNYATDGWRYLEAAPFDQSAGAPWGCFRKEIPGARGTAIGTGKQNTADMLAACAEPGSAAHLCAHFSLNGVRGWFLPSRDELAMMYRNLMAKGMGDFVSGGVTDNFTYWASTQNTTDMAAHIDFPDLGRLHGDDKDFPRRVRAVRAF